MQNPPKKLLDQEGIINVASNRVRLDGGLAQGISRGSRFALYPVVSDFIDRQQCLTVVEITDVQAATA
jgi:hypothetical protein